MIDVEKYEARFKNNDKDIMSFHEYVANRYKNINMEEAHKLLLSLGDCYKDTGEDKLDFQSVSFSIGANNKSLLKEKYEANKRRNIQQVSK